MEEWGTDGENLIPLKIEDIFDYTGAIWRSLSTEEMNEVAQFYAEDLIQGDIQFMGVELDDLGYLEAVNTAREEMLQQEFKLALVMDFVNFDVQVFYTFHPMMLSGEHSGRISLIDGMSKLVKSKGVLRTVDNSGDAVFYI